MAIALPIPTTSEPIMAAASNQQDPNQQEQLVKVFKLLSSVPRMQILDYLVQEGELNVTDLCDRMRQTQPAISHHLASMREGGAITMRRDGKHSYYSVNADVIEGTLATFLKEVLKVVPAQ